MSFFLLFSIFLEPEPKLFHVTCDIYIDILFFTWSVMGKQNNIVKFGVPGFLAVPVFRGALGCSGVFQSVSVFPCSGLPGFSTCHFLTIFDNA